jgi:hypothetical protein
VCESCCIISLFLSNVDFATLIEMIVWLHLIRMWCYFEMWINDYICCCLCFHSMKWVNIIIVTNCVILQTWEYDRCWFQDNDLDVDVFSLLLDLKFLCLYMSIDFFLVKIYVIWNKVDCLCICRKWILWWFVHDAWLCCMIEIWKWWYAYIHGINWEFICMNEIVELLEYFDMTMIDEYSWNLCDIGR